MYINEWMNVIIVYKKHIYQLKTVFYGIPVCRKFGTGASLCFSKGIFLPDLIGTNAPDKERIQKQWTSRVVEYKDLSSEWQHFFFWED